MKLLVRLSVVALSTMAFAGCDTGPADVQEAQQELQGAQTEAVENINEAKQEAAENVGEARQEASENIGEARQDLQETRQEATEEQRQPASEPAPVVNGQKITAEYCSELAQNKPVKPELQEAYKACSDLGY